MRCSSWNSDFRPGADLGLPAMRHDLNKALAGEVAVFEGEYHSACQRYPNLAMLFTA